MTRRTALTLTLRVRPIATRLTLFVVHVQARLQLIKLSAPNIAIRLSNVTRWYAETERWVSAQARRVAVAIGFRLGLVHLMIVGFVHISEFRRFLCALAIAGNLLRL